MNNNNIAILIITSIVIITHQNKTDVEGERALKASLRSAI